MSDDKPVIDVSSGNGIGEQTSDIQTGTSTSSPTSATASAASKLAEERNNNHPNEDTSLHGESDLHHVSGDGVAPDLQIGDKPRSGIGEDEEGGETGNLDEDSKPQPETFKDGIPSTPDGEGQADDQKWTNQEGTPKDDKGDGSINGQENKQSKTTPLRRTGSKKLEGNGVKKKRINSTKGRPKSRIVKDGPHNRNSFRESKRAVKETGTYSESKEGCINDGICSAPGEEKVPDKTIETGKEEGEDSQREQSEPQRVEDSLSIETSKGGSTMGNDDNSEGNSNLSNGTDPTVAGSHQEQDEKEEKPSGDDRLNSSQSRLSERDTVTSSHGVRDGVSPVSPRRHLDSRDAENRSPGRVGDRAHGRQFGSSRRSYRHTVSHGHVSKN
ncbi:uncharacterized protein LOC121431174 [Lytechinus variegatus]|uniref:uncharacterized protein LOC121431174 n=1 Tax=Lytechinus variegatus TaxID=7654 RepID=UPI001BB10C61|nr:uncharacterized protein LOC121431174 [Lytechinus variegatus]